MQFNPYLNFPGTCEEALTFYKRIFGGEITNVHRFGDSPMAGQVGTDGAQKILHARLTGGSVFLMASDNLNSPVNNDGNISLSIETSDAAEGERFFNALAEGGTISMPFEDQFWGSKFGSLTDRYGIDWMINCPNVAD